MYALSYPELFDPFLENLVANVPGAIYQSVLYPEGKHELVYLNACACNLFGLDSEAIGQTVNLLWDRVHPDDSLLLQMEVASAVRYLQPLRWQGRIISSKGKIKRVQWTAKPQKLVNQQVVWYGLILEIAQTDERSATSARGDRQRAARALKESERRFRAIFNSTFGFMTILSAEGKIEQANQTILDFAGVELEEIVDRPLWKTRWWGSSQERQQQLKKAIATAAMGKFVRYEAEILGANDTVITIDFSLKPVCDSCGKVVLLIAEGRDISDRKRAARALKESERRFRAIFNSTFGFITILSAEGKIEQANQTILDFAGVELEEIVDRPLWETRWWGSSQERQQRLKQAITTAATGKFVRYEAEILGGDDTAIAIDFSLKPVFDSCGQVVLLIAEGRDISERKALEQALVWRDELWNAFFCSAPVGMKILDNQLRYVQVNPALAQMNGLGIEEHLGKKIAEVLPCLEFTAQELLQTVLSKGHTISEQEVSGETPKQPGVLRHWMVSYFPLTAEDRQPRGVGGVVMEITDRKRAEEAQQKSEALLKEKNQELEQTLADLKRTQSQLIQAEKMSSLGQMVAGVAHEINNPVNFIYGNLSYAEDYMKDLLELVELYDRHNVQPHPVIAQKMKEMEIDFLRADLPKLLQSMKVGAERIREIVKSLRTFSRLDEAEVKEIDIHEGIDSTLMILRNRLKAKPDRPCVTIVKDYGNLPQVECFAGQLNQVFMNILANALDAIEDCQNGAACEVKSIMVPTIEIQTGVKDSDTIEIRISDNGPGMTETVKQRLFDPFFTTKPVGQGTGLGLSISYQIIVERHGGSLQCFSTPGEGTEFAIAIPIKQSSC